MAGLTRRTILRNLVVGTGALYTATNAPAVLHAADFQDPWRSKDCCSMRFALEGATHDSEARLSTLFTTLQRRVRPGKNWKKTVEQIRGVVIKQLPYNPHNPALRTLKDCLELRQSQCMDLASIGQSFTRKVFGRQTGIILVQQHVMNYDAATRTYWDLGKNDRDMSSESVLTREKTIDMYRVSPEAIDNRYHLTPLTPEEFHGLVLHNLAFNETNPARAITGLTEALAHFPNNALTRARRGAFHLSRKNLTRAEEDFQEAYVIDPQSPYGNFVYGNLRFAQRRGEEAEAFYTAGIRNITQETDPLLRGLLQNRSILRKNLGNKEGAEQDTNALNHLRRAGYLPSEMLPETAIQLPVYEIHARRTREREAAAKNIPGLGLYDRISAQVP